MGLISNGIETLEEGQKQIMPALPADEVNQEGMGELLKNVKHIKELADTFDSILGKVMQIRGRVAPKQEDKQPQQFPMQQPSHQVQSTGGQVVHAQRQEEKVNYKMVEIKKERVEEILKDLIFNVAPDKLPQEIKERQLKEFIGEDFKNFKYTWKGVVPVSHEVILSTISDELTKMINHLIKEESA